MIYNLKSENAQNLEILIYTLFLGLFISCASLDFIPGFMKVKRKLVGKQPTTSLTIWVSMSTNDADILILQIG